jgi:hypothetical protein
MAWGFAEDGCSHGPDRQWFQVPTSNYFQGTMVVLAEDGATALGSGFLILSGRKVVPATVFGSGRITG